MVNIDGGSGGDDGGSDGGGDDGVHCRHDTELSPGTRPWCPYI